MPVFLAGDTKRMAWSKRPVMLLVWSKHILLTSLMKFLRIQIHLKRFPRTSLFLDFYRLSNYLYFFLFIFLQEAASQSFLVKNTDERFPDWGNFNP